MAFSHFEKIGFRGRSQLNDRNLGGSQTSSWNMFLVVLVVHKHPRLHVVGLKQSVLRWIDWLIDWLITETCRSKSDGNLRREKMREFQKSFCGEFYRKVFWESFGKFCRKFYRKILTGKKFYGGNGEPDLDWDLESCWSVTAPVEGHRFTSSSRFT